MKVFGSLLFALTIFFTIDISAKDCNGKIGDSCFMEISKLHPSQYAVGYFQAKNKQLPELTGYISRCAILEEILSQKQYSYSTAQCYNHELKDILKLEDNLIPVVYNSIEDKYYVTDHHHLLYALNLLFKKNNLVENCKNNTNIPDDDKDKCYARGYIKVIDIFSNPGEDFFSFMKSKNYLWPFRLGQNLDNLSKYGAINNINEIPNSIEELHDDPYRAIFGLARSLEPIKFEKPDGNDRYFYQFKWAACVVNTKLVKNGGYKFSDTKIAPLRNIRKFPVNLTLNLPTQFEQKVYKDAIINAKKILKDNRALFENCKSSSSKHPYAGLPIPEEKE